MLRRMMMAASSTPPTTGARYWRLLMQSSADPSWYAAQEVELRGSIGGPDLTSPDLAPTRAFGLSWYSEGPPRCAFDGNLTNVVSGTWVAAKTVDQYVGWDFATLTSVSEVAILPQARSDLTARSPTSFKVQSSNDNAAWTDVATFTGVTGWAVGVWKAFNW